MQPATGVGKGVLDGGNLREVEKVAIDADFIEELSRRVAYLEMDAVDRDVSRLRLIDMIERVLDGSDGRPVDDG